MNVTGVPITAAVDALAAGAVIWNELADAPVTVKAVVRVSPTPETVTVTVPAVAGVTTVENVPVESVVPVVGAKVTEPVPDWVRVIVCPERVVPLAFFATTVRVDVVEPTVKDVSDVLSVSVDPDIRIGIWDVWPLAVATMVAVRVVALLPEENVTVALPVASLVAVDVLRNPVSTENAIGTPETAAFEALTTVAVIVAELLLSESTDDADVLSEIAAAVGVGVTGVVVVDEDDEPPPPPPQAASSDDVATAAKIDAARVQIDFKMCSCDDGWQWCNVRFSARDAALRAEV